MKPRRLISVSMDRHGQHGESYAINAPTISGNIMWYSCVSSRANTIAVAGNAWCRPEWQPCSALAKPRRNPETPGTPLRQEPPHHQQWRGRHQMPTPGRMPRFPLHNEDSKSEAQREIS
jgi:hypothetical protein